MTPLAYSVAYSTNHHPAALSKLQGVQVTALASVTAMNLLTREVLGSAP
jgi:hypothetical protein